MDVLAPKNSHPYFSQCNKVLILYFKRICLVFFVHKVYQFWVFSLDVLLLEHLSYAILFVTIFVKNVHNIVWPSFLVLRNRHNSDKHVNIGKINKLKMKFTKISTDFVASNF